MHLSVQMEWTQTSSFASLVSNNRMLAMYEKHARRFGWDCDPEILELVRMTGSSDVGNVSHVVPTIHPEYKICDVAAYHTPDFTIETGKNV